MGLNTVVLAFNFVGVPGPAGVPGWCCRGNSENSDAVLPWATGDGVKCIRDRACDFGQLHNLWCVVHDRITAARGFVSSQPDHAGTCWHLHWRTSWLVQYTLFSYFTLYLYYSVLIVWVLKQKLPSSRQACWNPGLCAYLSCFGNVEVEQLLWNSCQHMSPSLYHTV